MIVVDVGCHPQGPEESVHRLIDRFNPDVLFGFDPFPDLVEGIEIVNWVGSRDGRFSGARYGSCVVVRRAAAAWTHDGEILFKVDGITSGVTDRYKSFDGDGMRHVPCFDICDWIERMLPPTEIVLKLDAEGAEYPILERVRDHGLDLRLALVLVEWHPPETAREHYVPPDRRPSIRCPIEDW